MVLCFEIRFKKKKNFIYNNEKKFGNAFSIIQPVFFISNQLNDGRKKLQK